VTGFLPLVWRGRRPLIGILVLLILLRPLLLFALIAGPGPFVIATLVYFVYQVIESNVIFPAVIGESVDDVLGVLYLKDVIRRTQSGDPAAAQEAVADVMRTATFVPESKPVDDLLSEMQAARTHLVIVVDEYGGTAGLVTIEDILEEIVGEITDEYDQEAPPVECK